MAKLTSGQRSKIPTKEFAGKRRSFPIEDDDHARAAIRLAPRSENAGNISHETEEKIVAKARRKLAHEKFHDAMADKLIK